MARPARLQPHRWLLCSFALLSATVISPALACPVCDSPTGEEVRAGIGGGDLGLNVLAVLLPFVVSAGVVACIHFGGTNGRADGGRHSEGHDGN